MMLTSAQKLAYTIALLLVAVWNAVILAAPYWASHDRGKAAAWIYVYFSPICHQSPERSFHLWGRPLAVCHRCFGIYFGALMGLIVFPILRKGEKLLRAPKHVWFFAPLALMLADIGLDFLGLRRNTPASQFLTGFFCGIVTPFFLLPGIFEMFRKRRSPPNTMQP